MHHKALYQGIQRKDLPAPAPPPPPPGHDGRAIAALISRPHAGFFHRCAVKRPTSRPVRVGPADGSDNLFLAHRHCHSRTSSVSPSPREREILSLSFSLAESKQLRSTHKLCGVCLQIHECTNAMSLSKLVCRLCSRHCLVINHGGNRTLDRDYTSHCQAPNIFGHPIFI